jgi:hypothetical protein
MELRLFTSNYILPPCLFSIFEFCIFIIVDFYVREYGYHSVCFQLQHSEYIVSFRWSNGIESAVASRSQFWRACLTFFIYLICLLNLASELSDDAVWFVFTFYQFRF